MDMEKNTKSNMLAYRCLFETAAAIIETLALKVEKRKAGRLVKIGPTLSSEMHVMKTKLNEKIVERHAAYKHPGDDEAFELDKFNSKARKGDGQSPQSV